MKKIIDYIPTNNAFCVDWISVSFRLENGLNVNDILLKLSSILNVSTDKFYHNNKGIMAGYNNSLRFNNEKFISISYNIDNAKQGILLNITGQGCRAFSNDQLFDLFYWILDVGAFFTRLDIAFDDINNLTPVHLYDFIGQDLLINKRDSYTFISSNNNQNCFKSFINKNSSELNVAPNLTVGSRYSKCMVRAYNKALEQNLDFFWWRLELQLRYDFAEKMVRYILNDLVAFGFVEFLNSYFRIVEFSDKSKEFVSLYSTHSDWQNFINYLLEEDFTITSLNINLG